MQIQINDTIFHNWKVNKVIGAGSFGTVYEIKREEFGRVYKSALKVITIPDTSNDGFLIAREGMTEENTIDYYKSLVKDIIRECDLMERMKGDSHIVSFEDHYVEEHENGRQWTIYIRMELLKPLISFITDENNFLKRDQIIRIGIDICKGLEVCQQFNIVHRDIKLENIFVSDTGKYKLGDFGISKVMEKSELAVSQKGTKLYMAPEMLMCGKYDATVDIYSLGLVLYRLLNNNRAPFMPAYPQRMHVQDKENALQRRLAGEEFPNPCNADESLAFVVKKACSFEPKARYQTPEKMRNALEGLLKNPVEAYAVDTNMEENSKTLSVKDALGQLSFEKNNNFSQKHRKLNIIGLVICCVIFMMGIGARQRNIEKNTRAELIVNEGTSIGDICSEGISKVVATGVATAESEWENNWLIVPNVVFVETEKAIAILLEAGYQDNQITVINEYSSEVESGLVMYQSVESDTQVRKHTEISITVSQGSKPVVTTKKKSENTDSDVEWRALE